MKKILAFLFAVSLFYFVGAQSVLASSLFNVQSVSYFGPGNTTSANVSVGRGSPVTFDHVGVSSEYSFAFYAVNDIIRDDFPIGQQFIARKDMKLTAVFYPNGSVTPANARHVVVFADASSKIIDIQYVIDGGNAVEPNENIMPPMPTFAKYSETKWLTSTNISDLTGITSNRVYFLQYDLDTTTQFTVSVASGSGDGSYLYNTVVTATPDAPVGENVFSHWEDAEGNVLSYKESYKFTVLSNVSITAVYSASPVSAVPVVNMSDALALRDNYVSYKGQFDIPAGLTLVEYGFIFSRSSDVLTLDSLGATIVPSNVHNGQTGEFLRSFPNDTFNSVRAYLIVKNASNVEQVVYSDNYERLLFTTSSYSTGFEGVVKGGYTALVVNIGGIDWNLSDTLVGDLANDRKNGLKSARIQASGFLETKTLQNNITNISFLTAKYGTDGNAKAFVAVSSNGTNWIDVTDAINASGVDVTSTTLTEVSINLLDSPNYVSSGLSSASGLYVKISKTGGNRINIDDVVISMKSYPKLHEVIYNNATPSSENVLDGQPISNTVPTQTGYSFAGWYTDVALTQSYNASAPVVQSLQLYAKWTINQYTITFNSAGGSAVSPITQDYNSSVVAPADPTREGYSFTGWSPSVPSNMPANNLELTAQWSINQYTISFDSNEGSAVSAITQDFGTNVSEPLDPTREGHLFQGWFTDDNTFLNEYVFGTMPSQNITVYAKWEEQVGTYYTVTFNSNGGSAVSSQQVLSDDFADVPAVPTKTGYTFVNWQDESNVVWDFALDPITEDMTLYATWSPITYTLTFDNLQGTTQSNPGTYNIETSTITLTAPSARSGYNFSGWFTALEGGSQVTQIVLGSTGNVTLYARWTVILEDFSYTLNVNSADITNKPTNTTYKTIGDSNTANGTWSGSTNLQTISTYTGYGINATSTLSYSAPSGYYVYSISISVITASGSTRSISVGGQSIISTSAANTLFTTASPVVLNATPTSFTFTPNGAIVIYEAILVCKPLNP